MARVSSVKVIARRYAAALLDLADEAGVTGKIEKDMEDLSVMMDGSPELRSLTRSRVLTYEQQEAILKNVAEKAKLQPLTARFLIVLAENRRLAMLADFFDQFDLVLARRRGQMRAWVYSPEALDAAKAKTLQGKLEDIAGKKVNMRLREDPELIAGVRIIMGSRLYDDSVRGKLKRLERKMSGLVAV